MYNPLYMYIIHDLYMYIGSVKVREVKDGARDLSAQRQRVISAVPVHVRTERHAFLQCRMQNIHVVLASRTCTCMCTLHVQSYMYMCIHVQISSKHVLKAHS